MAGSVRLQSLFQATNEGAIPPATRLLPFTLEIRSPVLLWYKSPISDLRASASCEMVVETTSALVKALCLCQWSALINTTGASLRCGFASTMQVTDPPVCKVSLRNDNLHYSQYMLKSTLEQSLFSLVFTTTCKSTRTASGNHPGWRIMHPSCAYDLVCRKN